MVNLVVLSYGRESEYKRAILAVLSYYSWLPLANKANPTILFTDNPAYFAAYLTGLPIEYQLLDAEKIKISQGPDQYVHRIKIAIIEEALLLHPGIGVLFVDSDTFFLKNPADLFGHISPLGSVMHLREYALQERHQEATAQRLLATLANETFQTTRGAEHFSGEQFCWNSGVLGLDSSRVADLPDVYLLTDKLFAKSGWRISEQVGFSLILQTRTELRASDEFIYHYWKTSEKIAVDALLSPALFANFATLASMEKLDFIRAYTAQLPAAIATYLATYPSIEWRLDALLALYHRNYMAGYRLACRYLLKNPTDTKFIKDLLYNVKQRLFS
jgi:hypothetical protein